MKRTFCDKCGNLIPDENEGGNARINDFLKDEHPKDICRECDLSLVAITSIHKQSFLQGKSPREILVSWMEPYDNCYTQ